MGKHCSGYYIILQRIKNKHPHWTNKQAHCACKLIINKMIGEE